MFVLRLHPVWLCEAAGWEGAAEVLDRSCFERQISQRPAAEQPPGDRFHWVHGPRDMAPRPLQWRPQPGAGATPQHSDWWGQESTSYFPSNLPGFFNVLQALIDYISGFLHCCPSSSIICCTKQKPGKLLRLILTRVTFEGNFCCFKREFSMAAEILYKGEDSSSNNDRAC